MTIQETIRRAIEGGWELGKKMKESPGDYFVSHALGNLPPIYLLDPSFWQSLGKAMGWDGKFSLYNGVVLHQDGVSLDYEKSGHMETWRYHWHHFIDHLAEGKDINSFFETL